MFHFLSLKPLQQRTLISRSEPTRHSAVAPRYVFVAPDVLWFITAKGWKVQEMTGAPRVVWSSFFPIKSDNRDLKRIQTASQNPNFSPSKLKPDDSFAV